MSTGYEGAKEKQHVQVEHFSEEPEAPDLEEDSNKVLPDDDSEEPEEENSTDAPAPRRTSTREIRRPDYYGSHVYAATDPQKEPQTVKEARNCSEKEQWEAAMQEMDSIYNNGVWDLVELPANRTPVGNKWVFKKKTKADGLIERYKARLVAQGFSQKQGLNYDKTFSPVIRFESFRSLVAVAVQKRLKLHQLDITAAFLNGHLEEEVFMKQPEGFVVEGKEHLVCKLKQSLYGLKQSPRCWNFTLYAYLKSMGYVQSTNDPCIYTSSGGESTIIGVYVDDFVVAGGSSKRIEQVKTSLSEKFPSPSRLQSVSTPSYWKHQRSVSLLIKSCISQQ